MKKSEKTVGYGISMPKFDGETDKNCPFTSSLRVRGNISQGTVVSASAPLTATVQIERQVFVSKYKRYKKKISKIHVHNPAAIDAKVGDVVEFMGCRPLSKTKSAVIVRIVNGEQ
ncbi:MAG: 30S ribosomal protein S17 [Candidatus Woesearchaeota archaeon]